MALGMEEVVRRLGYHPATPQTVPVFEENRRRAIELALYYDEALPECPEAALAQTHLQIAAMFANAAVACRTPPEIPAPDQLSRDDDRQ